MSGSATMHAQLRRAIRPPRWNSLVANCRTIRNSGLERGVLQPYPLLNRVLLDWLLGEFDGPRSVANTSSEATRNTTPQSSKDESRVAVRAAIEIAAREFEQTYSFADAITQVDLETALALIDGNVEQRTSELAGRYRETFNKVPHTVREVGYVTDQLRALGILIRSKVRDDLRADALDRLAADVAAGAVS